MWLDDIMTAKGRYTWTPGVTSFNWNTWSWTVLLLRISMWTELDRALLMSVPRCPLVNCSSLNKLVRYRMPKKWQHQWQDTKVQKKCLDKNHFLKTSSTNHNHTNVLHKRSVDYGVRPGSFWQFVTLNIKQQEGFISGQTVICFSWNERSVSC